MISEDKASQLVAEVLLQGGLLLCNKGLVMHKKDEAGNITFSFLRNMSNNSHAEELYNGISATKAALYFTEWVGTFLALELATKWFREKNKVVEAKTMEIQKVEKNNA